MQETAGRRRRGARRAPGCVSLGFRTTELETRPPHLTLLGSVTRLPLCVDLLDLSQAPESSLLAPASRAALLLCTFMPLIVPLPVTSPPAPAEGARSYVLPPGPGSQLPNWFQGSATLLSRELRSSLL